MPGRIASSEDYRYGFNGKEKDDEVKGSGNSLDFGARMYDARLGRWLSRDPLASKFVDKSPYNFAINSPLFIVDPDGRDTLVIHAKMLSPKTHPVLHHSDGSETTAF